MQAGKLRHRGSIQRQGARVDDGTGGGSMPWNDLYANIPASIEPLSGNELLRAEQFEASLTHRVRTRYYPGVRPSDRFRFVDEALSTVDTENEGVRVFDIKTIIDPEERHRELELMCEELKSW